MRLLNIIILTFFIIFGICEQIILKTDIYKSNVRGLYLAEDCKNEVINIKKNNGKLSSNFQISQWKINCANNRCNWEDTEGEILYFARNTWITRNKHWHFNQPTKPYSITFTLRNEGQCNTLSCHLVCNYAYDTGKLTGCQKDTEATCSNFIPQLQLYQELLNLVKY